MKIQTFHYVPKGEVGKWLADGWEIVDDMATCHHGTYSVLMRKIET